MVFPVKSAQYLVNNAGAPTAVVVDVAEYRRLLHLIEDLEDALDLKRARESSSGTISHAALKTRLKKAGLL